MDYRYGFYEERLLPLEAEALGSMPLLRETAEQKQYETETGCDPVSPDGKYAVYIDSAHTHTGDRLYLLDMDTGEKTLLLDGDFDTIPLPDSAVVARYGVSDLEIRFQKGAEAASPLSVVALPYSVSVLCGGRYIFAATIECEDLRAMAPLMGISLKELQADYGIRGFLADPKIVLYGNGEKESLGAFLGSDDDDAVFRFLLSLVDDSFDAGADFEPLEG